MELLDGRSHNRLLEERSHSRADYGWIERVDSVTKQDESGCTDGGGCSQKRTQVPLRTNVAERRPTLLILEVDVFESVNSLAENSCDTGGAFGLGDSSKLFGRYPREWNSGALQSPNEFPREWLDEELLAVEQCLHREMMIDCLDKVPHAFDEEESARVAITAIVLKPFNRRQRRRGF